MTQAKHTTPEQRAVQYTENMAREVAAGTVSFSGLPAISASFNKRLDAAAKTGERDAIEAAAERIAASLGRNQKAVTIHHGTTSQASTR